MRERDEQHAAQREQPDLVAIPERSDRRKHLPALRIRARDEQMQRPRAQIEAVENHVRREHDRRHAEPEFNHFNYSLRSSVQEVQRVQLVHRFSGALATSVPGTARTS